MRTIFYSIPRLKQKNYGSLCFIDFNTAPMKLRQKYNNWLLSADDLLKDFNIQKTIWFMSTNRFPEICFIAITGYKELEEKEKYSFNTMLWVIKKNQPDGGYCIIHCDK